MFSESVKYFAGDEYMQTNSAYLDYFEQTNRFCTDVKLINFQNEQKLFEMTISNRDVLLGTSLHKFELIFTNESRCQCATFIRFAMTTVFVFKSHL